jgi:hypothetical protein
LMKELIIGCTMLSLSPSKSLAFQVEEMESSTVFYLSLVTLSGLCELWRVKTGSE